MRTKAAAALLFWQFGPLWCAAFGSGWMRPRKIVSSGAFVSLKQSSSSSEQQQIDSSSSSLLDQDGVTFHTLVLPEHRPLGCTVEESLGTETAVFCTSLQPSGNAAAAGLQVGDVIVGITGLFGTVEDISTAATATAIDQVKRLVAARPDDEPLTLLVARGTAVLQQHEAALAELCANPDNDDETEQCMLEYLQGGYFDDAENDDDDAVAANVEPPATTDNSQEDDVLLESLHNLWAQDMPAPIPPPKEEEPKEEEKKSVKPWSSRTSPSGTWVRDPATGELRNIDS